MNRSAQSGKDCLLRYTDFTVRKTMLIFLLCIKTKSDEAKKQKDLI